MVQRFFGTAQQAICVDRCVQLTCQTALQENPFDVLAQTLDLERVCVLSQIHGSDGIVVHDVKSLDNYPLRSQEGDFLITQVPNVGIAVLTADCLPLIFVDEVHHAVGIAHAGWKGSLKGVALKTLEAMENNFGTSTSQVQVFFGPCAKLCCYEVDQPFIDQISYDQHALNSVIKRGNTLYFDIPGYNRDQLQRAGVPGEALHFTDNICTLCSSDYCSYRRESGTRNRNISLVSLK